MKCFNNVCKYNDRGYKNNCGANNTKMCVCYIPYGGCNPQNLPKADAYTLLAEVRAEIQKLFSTKPEDTEYNNGLMDALIIVNKVSEHFS